MQVKEMREYLKDKVDTVPRSNEDVEILYNKLNAANSGPIEDPSDILRTPAISVPRETIALDNEYTYIGYGDTPPHMIKFMGIQTFVRGNPVIVTDPRVLAKIGTNRSFIKGKVDMESLFEQDELAAKRVQKQREEDLKTQIAVERQNRKG